MRRIHQTQTETSFHELPHAAGEADPVFAVKPLRIQVRRKKAVIAVQCEVRLSVLQQVGGAHLPREKFKIDQVASGRIAAAEARKHDRADPIAIIVRER